MDFCPIDAPIGRVVVPGHAMAALWFMIHLFERRGDSKRVAEAMASIKAHMEIGWDSLYDGLLLGVDSEGAASAFIPNADKKIWWPHVEAFYALLLARESGAQAWADEWLEKVFEYSFSHYPVKGFGAWTQTLIPFRRRSVTDFFARLSMRGLLRSISSARESV